MVQDTSGGYREEQSHGGGHSFTGLLYNILSLQTLQTILFSQSPSLLDAQDVRENQVSQIISLKKKKKHFCPDKQLSNFDTIQELFISHIWTQQLTWRDYFIFPLP